MNKRYWLKGSIMGFGIVVALILFNSLNSWDTGSGNYVSREISESLIFFPQGIAPANPTFFQNYWFLVPIIFYTVLFSIVGWIYGKIKNRNVVR